MKLLIVLALAVVAANAANLDSIAIPSLPEGRVINGVEADKGEASYIVSLQYNGGHFCGGSVVDEWNIVTAAHCLDIYPNSGVKVVAGLHARNEQGDAQIRPVAKQLRHAMYGGGVGPYDIGLIHLAEPLNLNAVARDGSAPVSKISMGSNKFEQAGRGTLFGWGRDNSGAVPNKLQKLDVDIIGYKECLPATNYSKQLADTNICTYTANKSDGACNGDSGGPLVSNGADSVPILVGIVSWGWTPCATTKLPSVYTAAAAYTDWVDENRFNSFSVVDNPF